VTPFAFLRPWLQYEIDGPEPRHDRELLMAAKNIAVTSDLDVLRYVRQQPGRYALFMGAGASLEADVLTADQICRDIRNRLEQQNPSRSQDDLEDLLNWNDPRRRYSTCLMRYGRSAAQRVAYFRELLKAKQPAFCHHSTALLMKRGILRRTCLTTNFDKLIEVAFAQQGGGECQPIRSHEEAMFWDEEDVDKCYVVKLHGDYDTHNILNTRDETLRIEDDLEAIAGGVLEDAGLIVLGAAGHEDSVIRLFDDLTSRADRRMLSMGLFWGVYVGPAEEERPADDEVEERVRAAIESGSVSQEIVEMVSRANTTDRESAFFLVWVLARSFWRSSGGRTTDRSRPSRSCTSIIACAFVASSLVPASHGRASTSTSRHSRSSSDECESRLIARRSPPRLHGSPRTNRGSVPYASSTAISPVGRSWARWSSMVVDAPWSARRTPASALEVGSRTGSWKRLDIE
jgi:hypothetical protein